MPPTGSRTVTSSKEDHILLAHGYGSGLGFFHKAFKDLSHEGMAHPVTAIDWLGMGGSNRELKAPKRSICSKSTLESTEAYFVESLEAFRKENDIPRFILVGHSLGALLATNYAIAYPERVSKLVLASPAGLPNKPKMEVEDQGWDFRATMFDVLYSSNVVPQDIMRLYNMLPNERGQNAVRAAVGARFRALDMPSADLDVIAEYLYRITIGKKNGDYALNSLLEIQTRGEHRGVYARAPFEQMLMDLDSSIPVHIVYGDHDWMRNALAQQAGDKLASLRPNTNMSVVPSGHYVNLDAPEGFLKAILE